MDAKELQRRWAQYDEERARILQVFGAALREQRVTRGSQEAFGEDTELHRTEIGMLERGEREPRLLTLLILANTLDITLNDLVDRLPTPQERRPRQPRPKPDKPPAQKPKPVSGAAKARN